MVAIECLIVVVGGMAYCRALLIERLKPFSQPQPRHHHHHSSVPSVMMIAHSLNTHSLSRLCSFSMFRMLDRFRYLKDTRQGVLGDDGKETTVALIRFQEHVVRGFIASSPKLKFCPYPGCTNTISCPSAPSSFVLSTLVPIASCGARGVLGSGSNNIRRRIRPRLQQRQQQ
ncbi:hypothetical protein DFH05DRAFT_705479 [Lentinula detonsa]|uniref:Uncharacterized protein n=1 Tax=Lentinula detonsa TaxID=2804962 RepID=A0A9W8P9W9_9AGAR|nr:hypothetical protein DFH05DRAFT_705479 [Lentinula detonsa]